MNDSVEFANPSDTSEILNLHVATFSEIGMTLENSLALFENSTSKVAVIREDGKIIAYAQWEQSPAYAYLSWIATAKQIQKSGYAQALLDFVIQSSLMAGCHAIGLDSRNRFKPAMSLYLKNGFDIIGTYLQTDGELMIRFRKSLLDD